MIAVMGEDWEDGFWLFGGLGWGSPSGPSLLPPVTLTLALSRC